MFVENVEEFQKELMEQMGQVHMTVDEAKEGECEKCGNELLSVGEVDYVDDKTLSSGGVYYKCKSCHHTEVFTKEGKRLVKEGAKVCDIFQ